MLLYVLALGKYTREKYRSLYNFSGKYVYENSRTSAENHCVCDEMAIELATSSTKICLIMIFANSLATVAPIYKLIYTDEKELVIPIILPFVDPDTEHGFYLNLANQLVICLYGIIIIPATELITCVLKNTIATIASVVDNSLQEFTKTLKQNKTFSAEQNQNFKNILLQILDFNRLVRSHDRKSHELFCNKSSNS